MMFSTFSICISDLKKTSEAHWLSLALVSRKTAFIVLASFRPSSCKRRLTIANSQTFDADPDPAKNLDTDPDPASSVHLYLEYYLIP
jgi:hypothetical protein